MTTVGTLTTVAGAATLAALVAMTGSEQADAADRTACAFERRVVLTAIEAYHASDEDFDLPTPAGPDGLDEVRAGGWLQTESGYWRYTGPDASGTPQLEQRRTDITDCV